MFLPDHEYKSNKLYDYLLDSPVSKSAISFFSEVYRTAKEFVAPSIFATLRPKIEDIAGMSLNLRSKVDKARFGRILTISELTYRGHSLEGFKPLHLLGETTEQLEMDFSSTHDGESEESTDNQSVSKLQEERDRAQAEANRYYEQLKQYEQFCRFLLVGKILPAPITTNGLEDAPLLQVFGGARSLSEVHSAYRELRKAWHPDISPFSETETNQRFDWLKKAYTTLVNNWSRFDPQNMDIPTERIEKLKSQQLSWEAGSFWYW